jgi:hypothetical protein
MKPGKAARKYKKDLEKAREKEAIRENREVLKVIAYPHTFRDDMELFPHLNELETRYEKGEKLNGKEIEYMCKSKYYEGRLELEEWDDYRFYRIYLEHIMLKHRFGLPAETATKAEKFLYKKKFNPETTEIRNQALDKFYTEWKAKIAAPLSTSDLLFMEVQKETNETLKKKKASINEEDLSAEKMGNQEREIIFQSKATYVKAKNTLMHLGIDRAELTFCGEEIHIDECSLVHILFKHFAPETQPYDDQKSHFTPVIRVETLIIKLKEILEKIEKSGWIGTTIPDDIFFKHYGRLYRVYFDKVTKSESGRGDYSVYRVSSFYPVDLEKDIADSKEFTVEKIDKWLRGYV